MCITHTAAWWFGARRSLDGWAVRTAKGRTNFLEKHVISANRTTALVHILWPRRGTNRPEIVHRLAAPVSNQCPSPHFYLTTCDVWRVRSGILVSPRVWCSTVVYRYAQILKHAHFWIRGYTKVYHQTPRVHKHATLQPCFIIAFAAIPFHVSKVAFICPLLLFISLHSWHYYHPHNQTWGFLHALPDKYKKSYTCGKSILKHESIAKSSLEHAYDDN